MTKIGFIGLGLIGGSIAKSFRKNYPDYELMAYTRSALTVEAARNEGVIDRICKYQDPAFGECDYIFLCAPVQTNIEYFPFLRKVIKDTCIITDVGSVKSIVVEAAENNGLSRNFIGGHPMAGSERTGFSASTDFLMENAYYFITPAKNVPKEDVDTFRELISVTKALPMILSCYEHDYVVAGVSHLPQIVASTLVNMVKKSDTIDEKMKLVAAGGFRDITRIASSSPEMWEQICLTNTSQISNTLDNYIQLLTQTKELIESGNGDYIKAMFSSAKDYRDSLSDKARGSVSRHYAIYLDIYDEAGGIATVTTLLAMSQINIKNIGIVNNREFEEGVLCIEFYDERAMEKSIHILHNRNYIIRKRS